ncbi:rCG63667 [Rattus norvegicus]|uniref:RCG63667 n=1 Tax=Rattus norvegicus TaxID=10116 RepID=A6IWY8_RAT|nr:rCG63667 [Rattus norvegicus]
MQQSSQTFPKCFVCSNTAAFFVRMVSLKPSPSSHYAALSAVDLVKAAKKEYGGLLELVLLLTSLVLGDGTLVLSLTSARCLLPKQLCPQPTLSLEHLYLGEG